jgi:hypothetical protein
MGHMKRSVKAAAAAAGGLLAVLAPSVASAKIVELGATTSPLVAPKCPTGISPSKCTIILTQVTALESIRDGIDYPTTVKQAGRIVAFTVGLSRLDSNRTTAKKDIHFLDTTYGGVPQVSITVLKRVGKANARRWAVTGESTPPVHLIPYLSQVAQFSLDKPLVVTSGEVIALTTPTWAPVLSFQLTGTKFAYRQSRAQTCASPASTSQAQLVIGSSAVYGCNYPGTRVEYSATEITDPVPTKNFVHAVDLASAASASWWTVPGQQ